MASEPHPGNRDRGDARASTTTPAAPLLGWRLLALFYDLWPVLAIWLAASAAFTIGYYLAGHAARENIAPFSPLQIVLWLVCWLLAGAYAVVSWRRGGQTLGMRPWRLRVASADGGRPGLHALAIRYAVGTLSLLAGGLGFWWAWFDRDRLTWHDRASGTRMQRTPKIRR
ncbi:RDD family protein [Marilutibacter chinensis]|uniref:RDD family protein n=1 Tax=Marilutibacter chinensis TaxID=2912247 RepID=A0ABS9HSE3_9GAMM|nr:RDD family protein [Lysobacter chinensis]MCF7221280.1 RDD family protein [Lysobacter chinensis]